MRPSHPPKGEHFLCATFYKLTGIVSVINALLPWTAKRRSFQRLRFNCPNVLNSKGPCELLPVFFFFPYILSLAVQRRIILFLASLALVLREYLVEFVAVYLFFLVTKESKTRFFLPAVLSIMCLPANERE